MDPDGPARLRIYRVGDEEADTLAFLEASRLGPVGCSA